MEFARGVLRYMKVHAFPDESVSMELVVTGKKSLVVTVVF